MLWPNGPLMASMGVLDEIVRLMSKFGKRRTGEILKGLIKNADDVVRANPQFAGKEMAERFKSAISVTNRIEQEGAVLSKEIQQAERTLNEGFANMTLGIEDVTPTAQETLERFGLAIHNQALDIAETTADLEARAILASALKSPEDAVITGNILNGQLQIARQWQSLVRDRVAVIESVLAESLWAPRGSILATNAKVIEAADRSLPDLANAAASAATPRTVPLPAEVVKNSAASIIPPTAAIPETQRARISELLTIEAQQRALTSAERTEARELYRQFPSVGTTFTWGDGHPVEVVANDATNINLRYTDGYAPFVEQGNPSAFITIHSSLPESVFPKAPARLRPRAIMSLEKSLRQLTQQFRPPPQG